MLGKTKRGALRLLLIIEVVLLLADSRIHGPALAESRKKGRGKGLDRAGRDLEDVLRRFAENDLSYSRRLSVVDFTVANERRFFFNREAT